VPDHAPLIIGHRGAPRAARENTVEAFVAARSQGADGVELDVHTTSDGKLVVHHDAAVPGFGVLAKHDFSAVRAACPWVPTLTEVLDVCGGLLVNIEVKNSSRDADFDPEQRTANTVVALLADRAARDEVLVSSFNLAAIDVVRTLAPSIPTGYLTVLDPAPLAALEIAHEHGHGAIHPFYGALGPETVEDIVARARELEIAVNTWTVDEEPEIARLAEAGVHAIVTDVPDVARRVLGHG
jgi:glycerophosphoryl diester phosphodiesterase